MGARSKTRPAAHACGQQPRRAAFASFSAAQWLSPYARTGSHYFFADDQGLRKLQAALKLTPSSKGENVIVTVPKDLGLLDDTVEPAPGAVCTSPVQPTLISPLPASVAPRPRTTCDRNDSHGPK